MGFVLLFAAEAPEGPPLYVQMMWLLPVALLFFLLILRPGQKQEQQRRALLAGLKRNDKIENSGGIIGIVDSVKDKDNEVVLKGGLRITKSSIVRIIPPDETAKDQKEGGA
jgi:preprotein translocase subunit YajC